MEKIEGTYKAQLDNSRDATCGSIIHFGSLKKHRARTHVPFAN